MNQKYYAIRFERDDALHQAGEQVFNSNNLLHIGQTSTCEIQLDNTSQYEDAVLAVIEKMPDDEGWKLIRISPYKEHEVRVNGTPIDYVHFLSDGDHIAFEGQRQELLFNIRDDGLYTSEGIMPVPKSTARPVFVWLTILSLLIIGSVGYFIYNNSMNQRMIAQAAPSVFKIKLDSVRLTIRQDGNIISQRTEPVHDGTGNDIFGTAFLTTDGMLVTARHCIEPWLNVKEKNIIDPTLRNQAPEYVRMALEAVTRNIMTESGCDSVKCSIVSYMSLLKPELVDSVLLNLTSDDFLIDNSRDEIMQFGDFSHQYFWRSITVRQRRIDMMLGDIAFVPDTISKLSKLTSNFKGTIRLATKEDLKGICRKPNLECFIMGRTDNNRGTKQLETPDTKMIGVLTDEDFTNDGYPKTVLPFAKDITPGYSGGPILTRFGHFGWRVIGVVSVKDSRVNGRFYSVPVTEIERIKTLNGKENTTKP